MTICEAWHAVLPPAVRVAQAGGDMWSMPATPRERAAVAHAVARRQREYQAGRAAARTALCALGIAGFDLLPGAQREPLWPQGIVGSITHTSNHCAAAVARQCDLLALGIDVEPATPLSAELVQAICSPSEQRALDAHFAPAAGLGAKLVFSAKESVYKAYFPAVRHLLDFHDVHVTIHPPTNEFVAELSQEVPALFSSRIVAGRFALQGGLLFTAVAIPGSRPCAECPPPKRAFSAGRL